jgi:hypothetical protein
MKGRVRGKKGEDRVVDVMKICRIGERKKETDSPCRL